MKCTLKKMFHTALLALILVFTISPAAFAFGEEKFGGEKKDTDIAYPVVGGNIYFDKSTGTITGSDCFSIEEAIIPSKIDGVSVTSIGPSAFCGSHLKNVTIPHSVTSIGKEAFRSCYLVSVDIPNSVTSIGEGAFENCGALVSIGIPNSVTSLEKDVFSSCDALVSIDIPNSVTSIGENAFYWCTNLNSVTIPNSVTSIGEGAFRSCKSLANISIPNSITSLEKDVFSGCYALVSIDIPNSVTSIGENTFYFCTNLNSVTIPNSVTSIGEFAFSLSSLSNVTIPNSVTSIGKHAFSDCSHLNNVTISDGVTYIGDGAFLDCQELKDIYYDGSEKQWNNLYSDFQKEISVSSIILHASLPSAKPGFGQFTRSHTYSGQFNDVAASDWYVNTVSTAYELGLMNGQSDSSFAPNQDISIAEAIIIACRLNSIYQADEETFDKSSNTTYYLDGEQVALPWYQPYLNYADQHGLIQKNPFFDYSVAATRADLAKIFGALPGEMLAQMNTVEDKAIPDVTTGSSYESSTYLLYRAGILTGSDASGSFLPDSHITRCEVATIAARIADPSLRQALTLQYIPVTLYGDGGKTIEVSQSKVDQYLAWGWKTQPFNVSGTGIQTLLNAASLQPMKTGSAELDAKVDAIFAEILNDKMSTYQKVKACYDYLIHNTVYGQGKGDGISVAERYQGGYDRDYVWDALELLNGGQGVCDDYAAAFLVMTRRIGLETYVFNGQCASRAGGYSGHAWNVIVLCGVDYLFDAQIEDKIAGSGKIKYSLFGKPMSQRSDYIEYDAMQAKERFHNFLKK